MFILILIDPKRIPTSYFGSSFYNFSICLWPPSIENGLFPNSTLMYLSHSRMAPRRPILDFHSLKLYNNEFFIDYSRIWKVNRKQKSFIIVRLNVIFIRSEIFVSVSNGLGIFLSNYFYELFQQPILSLWFPFQPIFYRMEIQNPNPRALEMPVANITSTGQVPDKMSSKSADNHSEKRDQVVPSRSRSNQTGFTVRRFMKRPTLYPRFTVVIIFE